MPGITCGAPHTGLGQTCGQAASRHIDGTPLCPQHAWHYEAPDRPAEPLSLWARGFGYDTATFLLAQEAEASLALDRDPHCGTYVLGPDGRLTDPE